MIRSKYLKMIKPYIIESEKTYDREFGNLGKIPDNHRKIVVSMDEITGKSKSGIEHLHIREFLTTFE